MSAGRTRWNFHRLTERFARSLVLSAGVRAGDLVLDIGAGEGAVTEQLLRAGARVIAVELHPERARALRERFVRDPVVIVRAGAADLRLPRRPFRVVANPPFSVTTGLLRRLLAPGSRLISADLVVPAHVAARWTAGRAPSAARWSRLFVISVVTRLPAGAFRPPAPMETVVLRIERRGAGAGPNAGHGRCRKEVAASSRATLPEDATCGVALQRRGHLG